MFVGSHWIDIVCHVCWLFSNLFWFRVVLGFATVQLIELSRRAKLTEEWADTLRHGRDGSFRTGMLLASKDSVLTWYHCREVTRHFRSKMNNRLTAVTFFVFLIPLISFMILGFGIFDTSSAAAVFVTPKFFVQVMFYSILFLGAIIIQIAFGSKRNTLLNHENLMISKLIAHLHCLSCEKDAAIADQSVRMRAVEEIVDGLCSVSSALKLMKGFAPETIFFVLPASFAILGSIASAFSAVSDP
jgi:hypothetical protein